MLGHYVNLSCHRLLGPRQHLYKINNECRIFTAYFMIHEHQHILLLVETDRIQCRASARVEICALLIRRIFSFDIFIPALNLPGHLYTYNSRIYTDIQKYCHVSTNLYRYVLYECAYRIKHNFLSILFMFRMREISMTTREYNSKLYEQLLIAGFYNNYITQ